MEIAAEKLRALWEAWSLAVSMVETFSCADPIESICEGCEEPGCDHREPHDGDWESCWFCSGTHLLAVLDAAFPEVAQQGEGEVGATRISEVAEG